MPRSSNAARSASEVSGDGGIGLENGMTTSISQRSRTPRSVRWSWRSNAHSLGAGGHLKGAPQTPTTARPSSKAAIFAVIRSAPTTE